jgi:excisionase family DNA binding protein
MTRQPLTSGEVARLFGVDPKTVARWTKAGKLDCFTTPGGRYRFDPTTVDALTGGRVREAGHSLTADAHWYVAGDDPRVDECDRCEQPRASHPGGGR